MILIYRCLHCWSLRSWYGFTLLAEQRKLDYCIQFFVFNVKSRQIIAFIPRVGRVSRSVKMAFFKFAFEPICVCFCFVPASFVPADYVFPKNCGKSFGSYCINYIFEGKLIYDKIAFYAVLIFICLLNYSMCIGAHCVYYGHQSRQLVPPISRRSSNGSSFYSESDEYWLFWNSIKSKRLCQIYICINHILL